MEVPARWRRFAKDKYMDEGGLSGYRASEIAGPHCGEKKERGWSERL